MINNKKLIKITLRTLIITTLFSQNIVFAKDISTVSVDHINWEKQTKVEYGNIITQQIPENMANIIFIRQSDVDSPQDSLNIAINGEYLTSLQSNNFTQVYSCAGINEISTVSTGQKTNDLSKNAWSVNLLEDQTYFFNLAVDKVEQVSISQLPTASAMSLLKNKNYQAHHVSRVTSQCDQSPTIAPPSPKPPVPPNVSIAPPKLEEKVRLQIQILFDSDQATIKSQYIDEVRQLADFMTKYSNTKAEIEGHTDSSASEAYNLDLSKKRAEAVVTLLTSHYGIEADRLSVIGYGESKPIASNVTREGRQKNRRVIAVVEQR